MKAILVGSIVDGFKLVQICTDAEQAEGAVIAHLANGCLAESMDVFDPTSIDPDSTRDMGGKLLVLFDQGLSQGATFYGPFASQEAAQQFGASSVSTGEDWSVFEVKPEAPAQSRKLSRKF